jgi:hypothetical protein
MSIKYEHLTQDEQDDVIAAAILSREREHHGYEVNCLNYRSALKLLEQYNLPDNYPEHLKQYKNTVGENLASAVIDLESYNLITQLQFRDRLRILLSTTLVEQFKTELIYQALQERIIDPIRLEAAISRVKLQ